MKAIWFRNVAFHIDGILVTKNITFRLAGLCNLVSETSERGLAFFWILFKHRMTRLEEGFLINGEIFIDRQRMPVDKFFLLLAKHRLFDCNETVRESLAMVDSKRADRVIGDFEIDFANSKLAMLSIDEGRIFEILLNMVEMLPLIFLYSIELRQQIKRKYLRLIKKYIKESGSICLVLSDFEPEFRSTVISRGDTIFSLRRNGFAKYRKDKFMEYISMHRTCSGELENGSTESTGDDYKEVALSSGDREESSQDDFAGMESSTTVSNENDSSSRDEPSSLTDVPTEPVHCKEVPARVSLKRARSTSHGTRKPAESVLEGGLEHNPAVKGSWKQSNSDASAGELDLGKSAEGECISRDEPMQNTALESRTMESSFVMPDNAIIEGAFAIRQPFIDLSTPSGESADETAYGPANSIQRRRRHAKSHEAYGTYDYRKILRKYNCSKLIEMKGKPQPFTDRLFTFDIYRVNFSQAWALAFRKYTLMVDKYCKKTNIYRNIGPFILFVLILRLYQQIDQEALWGNIPLLGCLLFFFHFECHKFRLPLLAIIFFRYVLKGISIYRITDLIYNIFRGTYTCSELKILSGFLYLCIFYSNSTVLIEDRPLLEYYTNVLMTPGTYTISVFFYLSVTQLVAFAIIGTVFNINNILIRTVNTLFVNMLIACATTKRLRETMIGIFITLYVVPHHSVFQQTHSFCRTIIGHIFPPIFSAELYFSEAGFFRTLLAMVPFYLLVYVICCYRISIFNT